MITPEQCRAARALLDWSQDELSAASKVSSATIRQFEKGQRDTTPSNVKALEDALVDGGVLFLERDPTVGVGVCLAYPKNLQFLASIYEPPVSGWEWFGEITGKIRRTVTGKSEELITERCMEHIKKYSNSSNTSVNGYLIVHRHKPDSRKLLRIHPDTIHANQQNPPPTQVEADFGILNRSKDADLIERELSERRNTIMAFIIAEIEDIQLASAMRHADKVLKIIIHAAKRLNPEDPWPTIDRLVHERKWLKDVVG